MTYDLLSPQTETARSLDDIGEASLLLLEDHHSHPENRNCDHKRVRQRSQRGSTPAEKRPPERLQQACERIQSENKEKLLTELLGFVIDQATGLIIRPRESTKGMMCATSR